MLGTPHLGMVGDEADKWIENHLVPQAVDAAKKAIADGKKVVFLAEGGPIDQMEEVAAPSEQIMVGKALRDLGADTDTWDDEATYIDDEGPDGKLRIDPKASATKALIDRYGDPALVEAALVLDQWDQMVDTNIKGLTYCTRAVLPGMVARKSGHVINMGSIAGDYPYPGGNTYGATKAFVKQFSRNLRTDLLGTRVRVTNIEPGMAESEFSLVRFGGDQAQADKVYAGTEPLRPEDIAEMVYWVVSLPPHVNINSLEVMPTCQSSGGLAISRDD